MASFFYFLAFMFQWFDDERELELGMFQQGIEGNHE